MARTARPVRFRDKWRIRWLDHQGKRCSAIFGLYVDADRELRNRQHGVEQVREGTRPTPPPAKCFDDIADYWLEHRAVEKRSKADDESIIRRHLRPAFGKLAIAEIGVALIDTYLAERRALAPKTLRNHVTLLGTMLKLAVELGWLHSIPSIRKPRADPDDDIDQPWLKTRDEIQRVLVAARAMIDDADPFTEVPYLAYTTATYTGMRAGEVAGLRWSDVDLDRRTIHVRRSYDGPTKTRASRRHVPIMDVHLPILRAWKLRCPVTKGDLVFPNASGRMHDPSARLFQETLHRVLDRAGFVRPTDGRNVHVIHFHSLRHTFACHWRLNGGPLEDLIDVLGHTSKAMTQYYANIAGYHRPEHFALFG